MKNVLIVSGHPDLAHDSAATKVILAALEEHIPDAVIDRLSDLYPDYKIDVPAEQAKLEAADIVVLQFPVFWYAMPSLLQKWMEDTFRHGWSHGTTGNALQGKKVVVSCTTGAPIELYAKDAPMGHTVEELFNNVESMAKMTGMEFAGMVYTGGVSYQMRETEEGMEQIKEKTRDHADRLVALLKTL